VTWSFRKSNSDAARRVTDKPIISIHSRLAEFGAAECEHYPGDGRNFFSLAVSQVQRYEFFLRMILQRYGETCTEFMSAVMHLRNKGGQQGPGPYEPAAEDLALLNKIDNLSPWIQLDSESFYVFAKILLDRIAKFLEDYFRPARSEKDLLRGYTFKGRHNVITAKFANFAAARKLFVPPAFGPLADEVREKIADFRDKHITHNDNMRVLHATAFALNGSAMPRMMKSPTSSRAWEPGSKQVESIAIHALMALLDRYLDAVFFLIVANREHSAFMRFAAYP
jgi:hypothetical protein